MKRLLSILIFLSFMSVASAGVLDIFKSAENFCIDNVESEISDTLIAAHLCVNSSPTKSCMKRVYADLESKYKAKDTHWTMAARVCGGEN